MTVELCFPARRPIAAAELVETLAAAPAPPLGFGDDRVVDFLAALAGRLASRGVAHRHPELVPVGHFLRRSALRRRLAAVVDEPDHLRLPLGPVLHVPPANVPSLFVYSWAVSALAGNPNVVRLSSRAGPVADAVLTELYRVLPQTDPIVARTQHVVRYGGGDEVTAALSRACRARVVWGGDDTVTAIRRLETGPATRDLAFPDRFSCAVASAAGWLSADAATRKSAVRRFHNDLYWYDQAACSSPLTLIWVGPAGPAAQASESLVDLLAAHQLERPPELTTAMQIEKRVRAYGLAVRGRVGAVRTPGTALTTMDLGEAAAPLEQWSGAGTLALTRVDRIEDLVTMLPPRLQTISHFGLDAEDVRRLARLAGTCGADRIVPFGAALAFDWIWDGHDLLRELSRVVTVR